MTTSQRVLGPQRAAPSPWADLLALGRSEADGQCRQNLRTVPVAGHFATAREVNLPSGPARPIIRQDPRRQHHHRYWASGANQNLAKEATWSRVVTTATMKARRQGGERASRMKKAMVYLIRATTPVCLTTLSRSSPLHTTLGDMERTAQASALHDLQAAMAKAFRRMEVASQLWATKERVGKSTVAIMVAGGQAERATTRVMEQRDQGAFPLPRALY